MHLGCWLVEFELNLVHCTCRRKCLGSIQPSWPSRSPARSQRSLPRSGRKACHRNLSRLRRLDYDSVVCVVTIDIERTAADASRHIPRQCQPRNADPRQHRNKKSHNFPPEGEFMFCIQPLGCIRTLATQMPCHRGYSLLTQKIMRVDRPLCSLNRLCAHKKRHVSMKHMPAMNRFVS